MEDLEGETIQDRQNSEYVVLKSIYEENVVDNRDESSVWKPLDLLLKLRPKQTSKREGVHCSVTLHIQCCVDYPKKPPTLKIHNVQGLSKDNATNLLGKLNNIASEKCKKEEAVVIYDLALYVQDYLVDYNKPILSFYDEMLENQQRMEQLKLEENQMKEVLERKKFKEDLERQKEIHKHDDRQRQKKRSMSEDTEQVESEQHQEIFYFHQNVEVKESDATEVQKEVPCTCPLRQVYQKTFNNKKIYFGACLGHSTKGGITNVAMDYETGVYLIAKKWHLCPVYDATIRKSEMEKIKSDLKVMGDVTKSILVPYSNMDVSTEMKDKQNVQCVCVLRNYVQGCSLKQVRTFYDDTFDKIKLVRHLAIGIFNGLNELHGANLYHGDVRQENVFLDKNGEVKLIGIAVDFNIKRINQRLGVITEFRDVARVDINLTAQLLLSFLAKEDAPRELPMNVPTIVRNFFSRCLVKKCNQWSAKQLLEHPFLKDSPETVAVVQSNVSDFEDSSDMGMMKADIDVSYVNEDSRMEREFGNIQLIGQGGFGKVYKVQNKLDSKIYAIKRLIIYSDKQLKNNIIREVALLSSLYHENVVRYYNSWMEKECVKEKTPEKREPETFKTKPQPKTNTKSPEKKLRPINDSIEEATGKFSPGVQMEWSLSSTPVQIDEIEGDSSGSGPEDDDEFDDATIDEEIDSFIQFEKDDSKSQASSIAVEEPPVRECRILYIQMEYCENNTLRDAIDNLLHLNPIRAWKMFRQIVEGLAHVHEKGLIHRDLKPVNIFLDFEGKVKIGDFGLATTARAALTKIADDNKMEEVLAGSLTGQVGTALYVAPEVLSSTNKCLYNQKVDIYSLGIILFEMFHCPLATGMERIDILNGVRSKEIKIPESFEYDDIDKETKVIKWLLNHDPSERPTCSQLLSSSLIPRNMPGGTAISILSQTLAKKTDKNYQSLIDVCMAQRLNPAENFLYNTSTKMPDLNTNDIKKLVVKIFETHGAVEFTPPFLQPRVSVWDHTRNAVVMMTSYGAVVHLPHDLRVPFARHIAFSNTKYMKRYTIGKVFREKTMNVHPREITDCTFDIITPKTTSIWPDASLLLTAYTVMSKLGVEYSVHLNHTSIFNGVLRSCGIPEEKHQELCSVLVSVGSGKIKKMQLQTHLTSLCLSPENTHNLLRLIESNVLISDAKDLISSINPKTELAGQIANGISCLEALTLNIRALGVDCPIKFAPCLACKPWHHSGIYWSINHVKNNTKSNRSHSKSEMIVGGGRYDKLIDEFWALAKSETNMLEHGVVAVGFSMSLEKIVAILKKKDVNMPELADNIVESKRMCVCVCVSDSVRDLKGNPAKRKANLVRDLLKLNIRTIILPTYSYMDAFHLTPANIVILIKDENIPRNIVVCRENDAENMRERFMDYDEIVEFVTQKIRASDSTQAPERFEYASSINRSISTSESERPVLTPSMINLTLITKTRSNATVRKTQETQVIKKLMNMLNKFGIYRRVYTFAVDCPGRCLSALGTYLENNEPNDLYRDLVNKYQQCVELIDDTIKEFNLAQTRKDSAEFLFVLFSTQDGAIRIVLHE